MHCFSKPCMKLMDGQCRHAQPQFDILFFFSHTLRHTPRIVGLSFLPLCSKTGVDSLTLTHTLWFPAREKKKSFFFPFLSTGLKSK